MGIEHRRSTDGPYVVRHHQKLHPTVRHGGRGSGCGGGCGSVAREAAAKAGRAASHGKRRGRGPVSLPSTWPVLPAPLALPARRCPPFVPRLIPCRVPGLVVEERGGPSVHEVTVLVHKVRVRRARGEARVRAVLAVGRLDAEMEAAAGGRREADNAREMTAARGEGHETVCVSPHVPLVEAVLDLPRQGLAGRARVQGYGGGGQQAVVELQVERQFEAVH